MNILVLNGSPKGDLSVTMQYVAFLQSMNPHHSLKIAPCLQRENARLIKGLRVVQDGLICGTASSIACNKNTMDFGRANAERPVP